MIRNDSRFTSAIMSSSCPCQWRYIDTKENHTDKDEDVQVKKEVHVCATTITDPASASTSNKTTPALLKLIPPKESSAHVSDSHSQGTKDAKNDG